MRNSKPHCLNKLRDPAVRAYVTVDGRPVVTTTNRIQEVRKPLFPVRSRRRRRKTRRLVWKTLAIVLATATAAAILHEGDTSPRNKLPVAKVFTSYLGEEIHPAFSAVGGRVAFAWKPPAERTFRIYTQGVDDSRPLALTRGISDEGSPVFSPDGASVAFLRYTEPDRAEVMVMSAAGGSERDVCGIAIAALERGLDWSPDGRWLVAADRKHLTLILPETGEKHRLTYPEGGVEDLEPSFAPDGASLIFTRQQQGGARIAWQPLTVTGAPDNDPRLIEFPGFADAVFRCPRWLPDGEEIAFVANRGGADKIWTAKLTGTATGIPEVMCAAAAGSLLTDLAVARQGRKLAFSRNIPSRGIYRLALQGKQEPGKPALESLFAATGEQTNPQYSPDGKLAVFESNRTGKHELWLAGSDGTNLSPLDDIHPMEAGSPKWSPNGRALVFETRGTPRPQVWSISALASGRPHCLTPDSDGRNPNWSADGAAVYFSSNRTGRPEIWRTQAGGGPAMQITHGGGWIAAASPDGKFLYYQREPDQSPLWQSPIAGAAPIRIAEMVVGGAFSATAGGTYYIADDARGERELWFWDSRTGKANFISAVPGVGSDGLSISPDGRFLLFSTLSSPSVDLMILDSLAASK